MRCSGSPVGFRGGPRRLLTVAAVATCLRAVSGRFEFSLEKHGCGICLELTRGHNCPRSVTSSDCASLRASAKQGCRALCGDDVLEVKEHVSAAIPDIRVSKGFGSKPYDLVRISFISNNSKPPRQAFFDYSAQFEYRWTQNYLHTTLLPIEPGTAMDYSLGENLNMSVSLPVQGQGVSALLMADPCVKRGILFAACKFGSVFQTAKRFPEIVNAVVPGQLGTDFWGILGDNFYDRTGEITAEVFANISISAKSKVFVTVIGNHDYWVLGQPELASQLDQCGNGFMQYYAQDTKAAVNLLPGSTDPPFNFSMDPGNGHRLRGCSKPVVDNFLWYNQVGNVGMIGQSGAYTLEELLPFMAESCAWLGSQSGLQVALLLGHWDAPDSGASAATNMEGWYERMRVLPGCAEFDRRHMLKFVMGHTHCNNPHPRGQEGAAFRVAGFGMEGCGNFGIPILDTTMGRVRFWYFDTSTDKLYEATLGCIRQSGWRACTQKADLWLDEPIAPEIIV